MERAGIGGLRSVQCTQASCGKRAAAEREGGKLRACGGQRRDDCWRKSPRVRYFKMLPAYLTRISFCTYSDPTLSSVMLTFLPSLRRRRSRAYSGCCLDLPYRDATLYHIPKWTLVMITAHGRPVSGKKTVFQAEKLTDASEWLSYKQLQREGRGW